MGKDVGVIQGSAGVVPTAGRGAPMQRRGAQFISEGRRADMPTYAAFLRGVSPMNAKMSELKSCLEAAGFKNVRTVLASGNVVFDARAASRESLERKIEAAMEKGRRVLGPGRIGLDRVFATTVRSIDELAALLSSDPYKSYEVSPKAKRIVTLLYAKPKSAAKLPIELDGARILCVRGTEVFSAYVPSPKGPVFMNLIEKTFGKDVTTRTWDTLAKVVKAAGP